MMPYLVSRCFLTESRAFSASPSLTPIPAITQKPCGSMKICPSLHSLEPTFLDSASYARTNHSPSHPASRTAWYISSTAFSALSAAVVSPIWRLIWANSLPYFTNIPAIKTDSATGPSEGPVVWNGSPGSVEKQFKFRQSFQSARPMRGSLCGPRWVLVYSKERRRCSYSGAAFSFWLSKSTISFKIEKSPVSFRYAETAAISQRGSSLKPLPISRFPFLVRGWYWW